MIFQRLEIVLFLLGALVPVGFFTTYAIAVVNGHVEAGFPYISDTGAKPKFDTINAVDFSASNAFEHRNLRDLLLIYLQNDFQRPDSCIFGEILTIGAFLNLAVVYTRYLHTKVCIESHEQYWPLKRLNSVTLLIGLLVTFGLTLVGNFQEVNVLSVHLLGAFFAFFGLFCYTICLTIMSYKIRVHLYSPRVFFVFRVIVLCLCFICGCMFSTFKGIANRKFHGIDKVKWKPTDGGFTEHVISTSSEWTLAILLMLMLISFLPDFKQLQLHQPLLHDPRVAEKASSSIHNTTTLV